MEKAITDWVRPVGLRDAHPTEERNSASTAQPRISKAEREGRKYPNSFLSPLLMSCWCVPFAKHNQKQRARDLVDEVHKGQH